MVTKCANPLCDSSFVYLRGGRLYLIERPLFKAAPDSEFQRSCPRTEYFWLCERCAATMTITSDREGHAVIASRFQSA